jgi:SNF2 family DNA or RNA helicase
MQPFSNGPPFNPLQRQALDFIGEKRAAILFMAPGAGKTRVFLETIYCTEGRTLVVAPKTVCLTVWPNENRKWGYNFPMRFLHGKHKHLNELPRVSLINYEALEWLAEALENDPGPFPWAQIIFDELSKMKNVSTKRWRAIAPWLSRFKYRLGGTGTPVGNHLLDIYGEVAAIDLGERLGHGRKGVEGFDRFKRRWFYESEYSYDITPLDGAEDEIMDTIRGVALAIDIDQIEGMPEISHIRHDITLPEAARRYYEELHKQNAVEDLGILAVNAAVVSGKSRQIASGAVYDAAGELRSLHTAKAGKLRLLIDELQGSPALVFFEFRHDLEAIRKALGNVPAIYGGTPARQVPLLVRQWNDGKLPVLALNAASAAYGLNMQEGPGRTLIWFTVPWSGELVNQGIARIWRQGQQRHVRCHYLLVTNTEDERVYDVVTAKGALHGRIMAGLTREASAA